MIAWFCVWISHALYQLVWPKVCSGSRTLWSNWCYRCVSQNELLISVSFIDCDQNWMLIATVGWDNMYVRDCFSKIAASNWLGWRKHQTAEKPLVMAWRLFTSICPPKGHCIGAATHCATSYCSVLLWRTCMAHFKFQCERGISSFSGVLTTG